MRSMFTHDILLLFAGPLVWAVHFVAMYGFAGVVCARPGAAQAQWLGIHVLVWGVCALGAAALAALAGCYALAPRTGEPDNRHFVRRTSRGLLLLAGVAVLWETFAVFILPACAAG